MSVSTSRSSHALETGEAKLWLLLVGVNQYWDENLPALRYSALDCQGLGEALARATQAFPRKELMIHNDLSEFPPKLETVRDSLKKIVLAAKSQDTILIYFSGHGVIDLNTQQVVLCLTDTERENLLDTGLALQELLQLLGNSRSHRQMVWLDACHSGDMTLRGARGEIAGQLHLPNPTLQLVEVLRQRAAQSKGFYALLSCDQKQRSWEFPELEHGLFTYYLMRGLRGEAADSQGVIEADALYKYIYHQTLQYIDKLNQQVRLINQQKRSRGEKELYQEYPLQTPKRIVEGVGELVLGLKPDNSVISLHRRQALVIDGLSNNKTTLALSKVLRTDGGFELEYWPQPGKMWSEVRNAIHTALNAPHQLEESQTSAISTPETATVLLYLRGTVEAIAEDDPYLVLADNVRLSRSWLRQELRRAGKVQQIVVLDCPGATLLSDWVEELKVGTEQGQCLIAAAASAQDSAQFTQALLDTLVTPIPQAGLSVAGWIAQLQVNLAKLAMPLHIWLSGINGVIEVLPSGRSLVPPERNLGESSNSITSPEAESLPGSENMQEHYNLLEKILRELVGPIASTLIRQVSAQGSSPQAWVENLALHLPPQQYLELEKRWSIALFQASTVQPQTKSSYAPSLKHQLIPKGFVEQCEQCLANFIGPIAGFLVQKTLKAHPQISCEELVEILAAEITDFQAADEFRQRLNS